MLKLIATSFILAIIIGCKSPVTDLPTYELPDADDSITGDVLPPPPEDIFVGPNDYIGNGGETDVAIDVIGNDLYVTYSSANKDIAVSSYKDSKWTISDVGMEESSSTDDPIDITSIGNTPYIVFADRTNDGKLRFKTFDGSSWVNVLPSNPLSDYSAPSISTVGIGSKIYIAYNAWDVTLNRRTLRVLQYDSESDELVTLASPHDFPSRNIHLSNINGDLFIAYLDDMGARTFIYNDNTDKWTGIGLAGTTTGVINTNWQQTFQIEGVEIDNEPYVAYSTTSSFQMATKVIANNGISFDWKQEGEAIVSNGKVEEMGFTQSNGVPYVAYADPNERNRLRVKYLTAQGYWADVDNNKPFLSDGSVSYIDITSADGILYVAAVELTEENERKVKVLSFEL